MIWVVSTHAGTRASLVPLIAARGYRVSGLECGDDAGARVKFQTPALIILDCSFPDSFEMLTGIRTQDASRRVPVVMFSVDDQNLKDRSLLAGADAYVPKGSLDWAELLTEIVRFVGPPPGLD